jgi:hypothetical protein
VCAAVGRIIRGSGRPLLLLLGAALRGVTRTAEPSMLNAGGSFGEKFTFRKIVYSLEGVED